MPGAKGKSGGKREGAGRPAGKPTKEFRIRQGDQFYAGYLGLVEAVRMDRKHLTIRTGQGEEITFVR